MISVVIPTYNRSATIVRSVRSVLAQTYDELEVIVVDDCSTDDTEEAVAGLRDKRIRYHRQQHNGGACVARNTGIDLAHGELIAFQDSDDEWLPGKLEQQLAMLKQTGAEVCYGQIERVGYSESFKRFVPELPSGLVAYESLTSEFGISTQTILAKRAVFDDVRFDPEMPMLQDYEWALTAGERHSFCFVASPVAKVYLQGDSLTRGSHPKRLCAYNRIIEKHEHVFGEYPKTGCYLLEHRAMERYWCGKDPASDLLRAFKLGHDARSLGKYLICKMGFASVLWGKAGQD